MAYRVIMQKGQLKEVDIMIGEKLKELRLKNNLTQVEVSKLLGIAQTTYAGYEGDKHEPDLKTLIKLADKYGVSLDYITGRYK